MKREAQVMQRYKRNVLGNKWQNSTSQTGRAESVPDLPRLKTDKVRRNRWPERFDVAVGVVKRPAVLSHQIRDDYRRRPRDSSAAVD